MNIQGPLVTIVIVNWNGQEFLKNCLDSIQQITYEFFNVIVVDNASTVDSPAAIQFLGLRKYAMLRSLWNVSIPWGWKDPRNTITLPIWLELFPNAKILHIRRHGVDVAQSLRKRELILLHIRKKRSLLKDMLYFVPFTRTGIDNSPRCVELQGGFDLWQEYMADATNYCSKYPDRCMILEYESFLKEPKRFLSEIASFAELEAAPIHVEELAGVLNHDRAFAYKKDPELNEFTLIVQGELSKYGYSS